MLAFTACKQPTEDILPHLTIINDSSFDLTNVRFFTISFSVSESDYDLPKSERSEKQLPGDYVGKPGHIFFTHKDTDIDLIVAQSLSINSDFTFTFTDSTLVERLGSNDSFPLDQILPLPQLAIERDGLNVAKNGTVNLGKTILTSPKRNDFIVKNTGKAKLILSGNPVVKISGDEAEAFSVVQPSTLEIAPNTSLGFRINFNPIESMTYTATITISSNDKNGDFTFTITAVGDGSKSSYVIGDEGQAGGIIFYDKGTYTNGWRYLEAAPPSTEFRANLGWGSANVPGTKYDVGMGEKNTELIVAALKQIGETGKAAQRCNDMTSGGVSDWFLPSINELNLMYQNLKQKSLGGFSDNWYWSSSESNPASARSQFFGTGLLNNNYKDYVSLSVRAARAF